MFTKDALKKYFISAAKTFVVVFLITVAAGLKALPIEQIGDTATYSLITGVIISAARTALSAVVDSFIPVRLGGRK